MTSLDNRPRVLLLIDIPDWAFHTIARSVEKHLSDRFACTILIKDQHPHIVESSFDLIHVFYEFEEYHRSFLTGKAKVLRSVYSHYWEVDLGLTPMQFYQRYLSDAHAISVPSIKLLQRLQGLPPPVHLVAEGVDTDVFRSLRTRSGPLRVGWAGKPGKIKRLEMLQEACDGVCELAIADGINTTAAMVDFYNSVDVIACTSMAEGCPRPILEGMACGCFPVSFDVGIATEVIAGNSNGLIVEEQSADAMRTALTWCKDHLDDVRRAGALNPEIIHATRTWKSTVEPLADLYTAILG